MVASSKTSAALRRPALKIVVTAASSHWSTAQIADAIGEELTVAGPDVHMRDPDAVRDLDGIDAELRTSRK